MALFGLQHCVQKQHGALLFACAFSLFAYCTFVSRWVYTLLELLVLSIKLPANFLFMLCTLVCQDRSTARITNDSPNRHVDTKHHAAALHWCQVGQWQQALHQGRVQVCAHRLPE